MHRGKTVTLPLALGAVWLLCVLGPLLPPGRALANRDIAIFHLPLRAIFKDLAELGAPVWNPWLHGGQPILPNPSYGAFYPPSWLIFLASPAYALSLMALLHAAIAFAGAWRLARHLGCGRGPAALAAVGYVGCGAYLSLLSAYNLFGSMAWLPWVLAWGDESLRKPEGGDWWRPALLSGGALGLQLLSGEPSPVVMSGLALLALTVSAASRRPSAAPRALVPVLFAVALAAVQLLPTLDRLADSPRREIPPRIANLWSMPPLRLVEVVLPRFFGDPAREMEGFFFGWQLNERNYPYVESLYPSLVLAVLGVSALLLWRIPRRAAWILALGAGCFLALGRHNLVYTALREAIPILKILRFPEKFILLSVATLVIAGVLGWQRLLDQRDEGRRNAADPPLALTLVVLAAALLLTVLLYSVPGAALRFIASNGPPHLTIAGQVDGLTYLRREGWAAVATAVATATLFVLCRWRRPSRRLLEVLATLLLAGDLWHYGHTLLRTVPASLYRQAPPLAAVLSTSRDRIFIQQEGDRAPYLLSYKGDPDWSSLETRLNLSTLQPYAGLLWHIPTAFDIDFELFLTEWGHRAEDIMTGEGSGSEGLHRYLGVWNIGTFLVPKTEQEQSAVSKDPGALPLHLVANPFVLPRFRFLPRVTFHPDHAAALAAARETGWRVARNDHWVKPGAPPATVRRSRPPRLLEIADEGARIRVRYRAAEEALLVVAMTYDEGWRASLDGRPLATYPTAACQLGVALPAGAHRLTLRFREPLILPGAAVSLLALAAGAAALLAPAWRRRWRRIPAP